MNQDEIDVLFAIIRSAIDGNKLSSEELKEYSDNMLENLVKISAKHDVAHLLVLGLKQNGLLPKENSTLEKYIYQAVYRYERQEREYENICNALEKTNIPFLPLKGSVLREYYPEAWMRTSCDIDILVHEEEVEKAREILVNAYGYTDQGKGSHDISLFAPTNIHIELHYDLIEESKAKESSKVLETIWRTATIRNGSVCWYNMPDEMFYFYHIAHMAKHFEDGGCGIRPYIDLWILDHIQGADQEKRDDLLNQGKLLQFANVARKLSRVWFGGDEHDSVSQQMEDYILRGGVYGNNKNRIIVQQQKKGGRIKYALSRIFIPYDVIKFHYPVLQKHRWLTPFMEVRRWCKLIFCGRLKQSTMELTYNTSISDADAADTRKFLNDIGL